jgi:hypothetical protein
MSNQARKRVRRSLGMEVNRKPLDSFAWPGGYPLVYLFADGGALCPDCANANIEELDRAMTEPRRNSHGGWRVDGVEPNYEDTDLHCDHCHKRIPAAYEDEEHETDSTSAGAPA